MAFPTWFRRAPSRRGQHDVVTSTTERINAFSPPAFAKLRTARGWKCPWCGFENHLLAGACTSCHRLIQLEYN